MKTKRSIQKLIYIGMLAAVAGALMSLEFFVSMMPPFYKIDFSDMLSITALLLLGPASAAWVEIIKIIIKLIMIGTNSMHVGGSANPIGVILFVIPMRAVYKEGGKTHRAVIALLAASASTRTLFACFCNTFITLPPYAVAMGLPLSQVIAMVAMVNLAISDPATFILTATIPFNLIKPGFNCFVGYLLYTRSLAVYPAMRTARGNAQENAVRNEG